MVLFLPDMAYASHESTPCTISINGEILPVLYDIEPRGNPDNSFYAGDSFHYLFTFEAIPECVNFTILPVESEGIFDVIYHNSITWSSPTQKTHTHNDYTMKPKYLITTHYYVDKILYTNCNTGRCQSVTIAENPSYSVREDKEISGQLKKLLDGLSTASTYQMN